MSQLQIEYRVDVPQRRDVGWFAVGLAVAKEMAPVWPDDWAVEMRRRGHYLGPNLGSFWAYAATQGMRSLPERRKSHDPERNGAKIFRWGMA